jgi:hypothetical protein
MPPGRSKKTKWECNCGTHQFLVCDDDDVNLLGENINTVKKNTVSVVDASKEVGLQWSLSK